MAFSPEPHPEPLEEDLDEDLSQLGGGLESGGFRSEFVNATSPGMLLAAIALTTLPRFSQDCISAPIVQFGATGAAEQHAELSLAGRGWYQETCMRERVLPAFMRETAEILTNRSRISSGTA